MNLTLTWTITSQEHAVLQRLVALEGVKGERVEDYAARVGLKGLRGTLEGKVAELREAAIDALTTAWDAADPAAKAAALDPLGYTVAADGTVQPKA